MPFFFWWAYLLVCFHRAPQLHDVMCVGRRRHLTAITVPEENGCGAAAHIRVPPLAAAGRAGQGSCRATEIDCLRRPDARLRLSSALLRELFKPHFNGAWRAHGSARASRAALASNCSAAVRSRSQSRRSRWLAVTSFLATQSAAGCVMLTWCARTECDAAAHSGATRTFLFTRALNRLPAP
jgi:hypothetical protein